MDNDDKSRERTNRVDLRNYQEKDIDFFLAPDGMMFTIPPRGEYKVVWNHTKNYPVELTFKQNKEGVTYCSLGTNKLNSAVYDNGKLVYGIEVTDLTEVNRGDTQQPDNNRVRLTNNHDKEIGLTLEIEGMDFVIQPGSIFEFIWPNDDGAIIFVLQQDKENSFYFSLGTGTVFANVYRDGELIYPIWEESGIIRDWRTLEE